MSIKRIISIALTVVMVISLCACGSGSSSNVSGESTSSGGTAGTSSGGTGTPSGGGDMKDTLVIGVFSDPIDMNPNYQTDQYSHMIKRQMYETLCVMDQQGVLQPALATEWEYTDNTTLVIKLRQGVKFHTGGEMKASDVLFSLNLISESNFSQIATSHVDLAQCEAVDDYTVKIKLKEPFAAQINWLNWPLTAIVSEEGYKQINGEYDKTSIGTGPYKLVRYVKDSEIAMSVNEDYWEEGKPGIPNILFRIIPEATTRSLELESGGIDIAMNLSNMDVDRVEENPALSVLRWPSYRMVYLFMNQKNNEYLRDYNVRQAICMAVDWENATNAAYGASGKYAPAYIPEGVEGYKKLDALPYDPEGAKKILQDAGYSDGEITINLYTSNVEARVKLCEIIQAFLADIGVKINIVTLETTAFHDAYTSGEHDMVLMGYFSSTGESSRVLSYFKTDSVFKSVATYTNTEFDKLVDQAMAEVDTETRIKMYQEAQEMYYKDLVCYPIIQDVLLAGTQANVKGLLLDSCFESPQFKYVYFE